MAVQLLIFLFFLVNIVGMNRQRTVSLLEYKEDMIKNLPEFVRFLY